MTEIEKEAIERFEEVLRYGDARILWPSDCKLALDALRRVAEDERLECEGLLVRLPCKVGDTVYSPRKSDVLEQQVDYVSIDGAVNILVRFECDYECEKCPHCSPYTNYEAGDGGCNGEHGEGGFSVDDFGKTAFLTRQEAEAASGGANHG